MMAFQLGPQRYWTTLGAALAAGDQVEVTAFYEGDSSFSAGTLVRDSFRSAADEFPRIFSGAKWGDCGSYNGWFALWLAEAPGFTGVAPAWTGLYVEYRSLLQQAVATTWEIHLVCTSGGGTISDEAADRSLEFIEWAYPRSEQMLLEARELPRP